MISGSFSYFDAAVAAVMALSCMFAFFRGLVKELLSLGAWIGAGLITLYYFPDLAKALEPRFKSPVVASGIATLTIYVTALIGFSMINALIMRMLKDGSDIGALDNTLGLFFGALRGAFVVSLAYLMVTMVMTEEEMPPWVKTAKTRPVVEKGAILLARASPGYLRDITTLRLKIEEQQKATPQWMDKQKGNSAAFPQDQTAPVVLPSPAEQKP
jgi:membrane protein required for colicin V production